MSAADVFDAVVEGRLRPGSTPESVRDLLAVAQEVSRAFAAARLDPDDQARIYSHALALLGDAVDANRRGWQRLVHIQRPLPAIVGGAAALTIGAAVGWAVLHGRRSHSRPLAA